MNEDVARLVFDSEQVAVCVSNEKPIAAGSTTRIPAKVQVKLRRNLTFNVCVICSGIER